MINVFQPSLDIDELLNVAKVFQSNWIGRGKKVTQFESAFAKHLKVSFEQVTSVNSCTEGLFQILEYIDVRGKEVILPSIHFIGAANAIIANSGIPVFSDVNPQTLNVEAQYIRPLITRNTKAIIVNHYGGYPCNMEEIMDLGLIVVEDAACAPSSTYQAKACGTIGHYGVWSFDAMKILSTGDGGMIYARDGIKDIKKRLYLSMDSSSGLSSDKDKWWEFTCTHPGRRSIMNDITASIGLAQLEKLPEFIGRRSTLTGMYLSRLQSPIVPSPDSSYYFFWIQVKNRDKLARHLKENGIYTTFRYYPLHKALGINIDLPNTEKAANETLLLPLHQSLDYNQVMYICEEVLSCEN